ncbi:MAG: hypothetical protein ACLTE2_04635 [Eubacteriales bacterium]
MAVKNHLHHELPISEQMLWIIDQHINSGGVRVDVDLIQGALSIDVKKLQQSFTQDSARAITGLDEPNDSALQLKQWVEEQTGMPIDSTLLAADLQQIV